MRRFGKILERDARRFINPDSRLWSTWTASRRSAWQHWTDSTGGSCRAPFEDRRWNLQTLPNLKACRAADSATSDFVLGFWKVASILTSSLGAVRVYPCGWNIQFSPLVHLVDRSLDGHTAQSDNRTHAPHLHHRLTPRSCRMNHVLRV